MIRLENQPLGQPIHANTDRRNFLALGAGTILAFRFPSGTGDRGCSSPRDAEGRKTVIGFLSTQSPGEADASSPAFRQGLSESGYAVGQNVP